MAQTQHTPAAIELRGITKRFGKQVANDHIDLTLRRGEIHALLGENGAGKSTLMGVLFGMHTPDEGEILRDGVRVSIRTPNDAAALGIGMVHQHFKLVEVYTVLDNIMLGDEPRRLGVLLDRPRARRRVMELSARYGLNIDPDARVEDITVGMQQRAEILKMLYRERDVLIFDEPTAVLTPQEIEEFLDILRRLRQEGKSILFITHKLSEITAVADRCSVIRRGRYIGTVDVADTDPQQLSEMMVGHAVPLQADKSPARAGETVLSVQGLCYTPSTAASCAIRNISLEVRAGEIVAIAGIDGNGQSELSRLIAGVERPAQGRILLCGRDVTSSGIRARAEAGLSLVPEDRQKQGLVGAFSVAENLVLRSFRDPPYARGGVLRGAHIDANAAHLMAQYDVRTIEHSPAHARADSLSGGNQQKVILARELERPHRLLMAVQPTRGMDVGAIAYIHRQFLRLRDAGDAVLLFSLELEEVMQLADRILVIHRGEIVAQFDPRTVTTRRLGLAMAGGKTGEEGYAHEQA